MNSYQTIISINAFYNENSKIKNKYEHCVKELGISTIIVDKDKLNRNDNFTCVRKKLKRFQGIYF